ncbi:hypothetical protein HMF8227_01721 [Saliniradius amylolyticus]|uniref:Response regulatory domain-containing protein n=1 Tax=Saliniradius amylolyticus TaxID=2183582 RepID=A0A2S2E3H4_9ALTE|nr:response regulator [Saliniradius amylolyticus]AWL12194.1 hypothetical protein HMF8227_01721 [Saliniradius amylolyticus]
MKDNLLNISIIEDNQGSRALLADMLQGLGQSSVKRYKDCEQFLSDLEQAPDLVLLGYDLGGTFKGTELARYCSHNRLVPEWTQFAFITNYPQRVSADLPQRLCPVPIYQKPISNGQLTELVNNTRRLLEKTGPIIKAALHAPSQTLVDKLTSIRSEELKQPLRDVVMSVQATVLLRAGHGNLAWEYASELETQELSYELQLNIAYQQGEQTTLLELLDELAGNGLLRHKQLFYRLRLLSRQAQYGEMLDVLAQIRDSELSPSQIVLKAYLLYLNSSYAEAMTYLDERLNAMEQDDYYLNTLLCWSLCLTLLESRSTDSPQEALKRLHQFKDEVKWHSVGRVFQRFERLLDLAILAVTLYRNKGESGQELDFNELEHLPKISSVFECTTLAFIYIHLDRSDNASQMLFEAEQFIARMQTSPERIAAGLLHRQLFTMLHKNHQQQAMEYNRWGLTFRQDKRPYRALALFARAHQLCPRVPGFLLNLLTLMQQLDLAQFWEVQQDTLINHLKQLPLSEAEQQRLAKLLQ